MKLTISLCIILTIFYIKIDASAVKIFRNGEYIKGFKSLQMAINQCKNNDSIHIDSITIYENITFPKNIRNISIVGTQDINGQNVTTLRSPLTIKTKLSLWNKVNDSTYQIKNKFLSLNSSFVIPSFSSKHKRSSMFVVTNKNELQTYNNSMTIFADSSLSSIYVINRDSAFTNTEFSLTANEPLLKTNHLITLTIKNIHFYGVNTHIDVQALRNGNYTIKNCTFSKSTQAITFFGNKNCSLKISHNSFTGEESTQWSIERLRLNYNSPSNSQAIKITHGSYNIITRNTITGYVQGLSLIDSHRSTTTINNNKFCKIFDNAIRLDLTNSKCNIYGNLIYDTFSAFNIFCISDQRNSINIYRNKILINRNSYWNNPVLKSDFLGETYSLGTTFTFTTKANHSSKNINIYHNTIKTFGAITREYNNTIPWENIAMLNNIFYSKGKESLIFETGYFEKGNIFDGNLYYKEIPGALFTFWDTYSTPFDQGYDSLSQAKRENPSIPWEINGIQGNPNLNLTYTQDSVPNMSFDQSSVVCNHGSPLVLQKNLPDTVTFFYGNPDIGADELFISDIDTIKPTVTLKGAHSIKHSFRKPFIDPGFYAFDNKDGDITKNVEIIGHVNVDSIGIFMIQYRVRDSDGNSAPIQKRVVEVVNTIPSVTISQKVNHSQNDAEENSMGKMYTNSSDLELVNDPWVHGDQVVGIHFTDIIIPPQSKILSAHITFTIDEKSEEDTNLEIYSELNTESQAFTQNRYNISQRAKSSNFVRWRPGNWNDKGIEVNTPELKEIIQEVINIGSWQTGNPLTFIITGYGRKTVASFENKQYPAPRLQITFIPPEEFYSISIPIGNSEDDGEENLKGEVYLNSTDLEITDDKRDHGIKQTIGLRFRNIPIPKDSRIISATIKFQSLSTLSEVTRLTINGERNTFSLPFSNYLFNISNRLKTTSKVSWNPSRWLANTIESTSNIKSIIQEIVTLSSWEYGSPITITINGIGKRHAASFDRNTQPPTLEIIFTNPINKP